MITIPPKDRYNYMNRGFNRLRPSRHYGRRLQYPGYGSGTREEMKGRLKLIGRNDIKKHTKSKMRKIIATQTYIREFGKGEAYGLHKPIPVTITSENGIVGALFSEANIYDEGKTAVKAIANLKDTILDEFEEFVDINERGIMGNLLLGEWKILQSYIYKETKQAVKNDIMG